jgi:hypothetical protein
MSSAGHIVDMINRYKSNRAMQKERRQSFNNMYNHSHHSDVHVPDTPYEHIKEGFISKVVTGFGLLVMVLFVVGLGYYVYSIL